MPTVATRKRGQPTKLTPQSQKAICDAVAAGMPFNRACLLGGVDPSTVSKWRLLAEEGRGEFVNFFTALMRARADGEIKRLSRIEEHGQKDWRADAWWLEAVMPNDYSRKIKHEVTGEGGGPIVLTWPEAGDGAGD